MKSFSIALLVLLWSNPVQSPMYKSGATGRYQETQPGSDKQLVREREGAIIRMDTTQKVIYLAFTAHDYGEGLAFVLRTLRENESKASFFLTGDFLRNPDYRLEIREIIKDGHYIGPHSDKHLLYCDWSRRDSLLVSEDQFSRDIRENLTALEKLGSTCSHASWFMPPYEWYNARINGWAHKAGLKLVNFTPGAGTNADYTTPLMTNYRSSEQLFRRLLDFEERDPSGLNGAILLIHPGTAPERTDKFYNHLPEIIRKLKTRGYTFSRLH